MSGRAEAAWPKRKTSLHPTFEDPRVPFPIAYIAGQFPLRSETFVWREVRELRRRGWDVHTFGLRAPEEVPEALRDLRETTGDVYALPRDAGAEAPGSGSESDSRTGASAPASRSLAWWRDAARPGEPTTLRNRLTLRFQQQAGRRLATRLRSLGVRHVHAHFAHAPTSVAMYAAAEAGISFSFTGHANDLFQRRQLLRRKLERASFVACISEWHRDLYCSIHPGGRYEVVRCGVPVGDYGPPPPRDAGRLRVLTVCRLVEKKGVDTLLRAAATVEGVDVTVAGDGPMRAALERLAPPHTAFLGSVDAGDVPDLLRRHDVFALPCRPAASGDRDGIPVALMEAMAGGLPVVSGDLPAIRELVADNVGGRLLDVGASLDAQADALADVLRRWRDAPDDAARLALAGRERAAGEFALSVTVDGISTLFEASAP